MIKDFKFHSPAPVYFGHETVKNNADLIASYGKRCYITTTRFPAGCYDVLMKNVKPGKKVVVVGGGMTGCELAYDLAAYEHCDVTLVEALDKVMSSGPVVPHAVHDMLLDLLDHFNVKVMTGHAIAAVNDEGHRPAPEGGHDKRAGRQRHPGVHDRRRTPGRQHPHLRLRRLRDSPQYLSGCIKGRHAIGLPAQRGR